MFPSKTCLIHKTRNQTKPRICHKKFRIDVTFEMRTAVQSDAFIQLMITYKIKSYFISEMEEGAKCKMAERQREIEGERASIGRRQI